MSEHDIHNMEVFVSGTVEAHTVGGNVIEVDFEDVGREMEIDLDGQPIEELIVNMDDATLAPSREVLENERE